MESQAIFCQVSNARFNRFPVGQVSQNSNTTRRSVLRWKLSEQNFENFTVSGRFFQKRRKINFFLTSCFSGRHNSALVTDRRKFTTKISLYGISSFRFYRWNQSHFPGLYTPCKKHPQIFCDIRRGMITRQITLTSLSCSKPITIDYWVTWQ